MADYNNPYQQNQEQDKNQYQGQSRYQGQNQYQGQSQYQGQYQGQNQYYNPYPNPNQQPNPNLYQNQNPYSPYGNVPGKSAAVASLTLGIVGLCLDIFLIGLIMGIVGLVLAAKAKREGYMGGICTAGFILSLLALVFGGIFLLFYFCDSMAHSYYYYSWWY